MQSRVSSTPVSAARTIAHAATMAALAPRAWPTRGLASRRAESHPAEAPTSAKGGARCGKRDASAILAFLGAGWEGRAVLRAGRGRRPGARDCSRPGYEVARRNALGPLPMVAIAR